MLTHIIAITMIIDNNVNSTSRGGKKYKTTKSLALCLVLGAFFQQCKQQR